MKRTVGLICFAACLLAAVSAKSQQMRDGSALLTAMHDRYKDTWYASVSFKQKSVTISPDGTSKTEIWDEALVLPGKLRINFEPVSDASGYLFADNSLTRFEKGKASETQHYIHMLLVLGFDVYKQDAGVTADEVKSEGYDLSKIHEDKWDGEDYYVVGADPGDLKSKQFWIEKKRLLFVRLIQPDTRDAAKIHESRFRDYRKLGAAWISARVEAYTDGKNVFYEEYFDIKGNPKLDPALFDPKKFTETHIDFSAQ